MEVLQTYYILQDKNTGKYLAIDSNSGGYPVLLSNPNSAAQFLTLKAIDDLLNGSKNHCAYKTTFPEECGNLLTRNVKIILE